MRDHRSHRPARSACSRVITLTSPKSAYRHSHFAWIGWLLHLVSGRTIAEQVESEPDGKVFAVFIADLDDRPTSPYDQALRRQIASGERSELYA